MTSPPTTTTALESLCACGVTLPVAAGVAAQHDDALILAWCEYASRRENASMRAGALINSIRGGQMPPPPRPERARTLDEQQVYADQVVAWLREHFPEFDRPVYGPHPAAVAAVIRLHGQHGKGKLTKREHGAEIRAAVRRFEEEDREQ